MPIQDVPLELMRMIFSDYSKRELAILQRTSKHLSRIIEPLLYESIDWQFHKHAQRGRNKAAETQLRIATHKPPIHLLLRTLLDRPELGENFKEITLQEHKSIQSIWKDQDQPELEFRDLERLASRAAEVTYPQSERWLDELRRGNHEAFVTLLLYYCPNVQRLVLGNDFRMYWSWNTTPVAPNIDTLWQAILNLRSLREIDFDRNGRADVPYKSKRPSSLIRLPNIKSIKASYNEPEVRSDDNLNNVQNLDVEALELHNSYLSEESIALLVGRTPNLTSLRIGLKFPVDQHDSHINPFLDCAKFGRAFDGLFSSSSDGCIPLLEHLSISIRVRIWERNGYYHSSESGHPGGYYFCDGGPFDYLDANWPHVRKYYGIKASIGSLKRFSRLKSLEISPEILLGWYPAKAKPLQDLIPDSVTHLCLRADFGTWLYSEWGPAKLGDLFAAWERNPHNMKLENVKFVFPDRWWIGQPFRPKEFKKLEATCMAAGLQVEIQKIVVGEEESGGAGFFSASTGPYVSRTWDISEEQRLESSERRELGF